MVEIFLVFLNLKRLKSFKNTKREVVKSLGEDRIFSFPKLGYWKNLMQISVIVHRRSFCPFFSSKINNICSFTQGPSTYTSQWTKLENFIQKLSVQTKNCSYHIFADFGNTEYVWIIQFSDEKSMKTCVTNSQGRMYSISFLISMTSVAEYQFWL